MNKNTCTYSIDTVRNTVDDFNKSEYAKRAPTVIGGEIPPCGKIPLAVMENPDKTKACIELYPESLMVRLQV